jgi:hypothetical protein
MPVKRRTSKSRNLDSLKIKELFYGPGTCLLAGAGYWQPLRGHPGAVPGEEGGFFWNLTEAGQRRTIERMREDWFRHRDEVLAAWDERDEHDLYIWREHHSDCVRPWAETEFGEPS